MYSTYQIGSTDIVSETLLQACTIQYSKLVVSAYSKRVLYDLVQFISNQT